MNERTLRVLEFDKIRHRLAEFAGSDLGKELALALTPSVAPEEVAAWQAETTEAKELWQGIERVPLGGIYDIRRPVKEARVGRTLPPEDLLITGSTLRAARLLKDFFSGEREEDYPVLSSLASELVVFPEVEKAIDRVVGPEGTIRDDASPKLATLRSRIRILQNRLKDKLDSLVRSGENQKYLQEALVTIRNGRYVLPVKQEYKANFPGIVHDQSASGATLFIEPIAVVELNNQLRQVEAEEEEEVARILRELSGLVGAVAAEIQEDLKILARIDLAFAKARYSLTLQGTEPVLNSKGYIRLIGARHPLLTGDVVPIDLELGGDFHTLVITGPNTGGKTVSLKTVGLLTLMAQAGLHLPARSGTETAIFSGVYSDIGDEQSIEQSLSTFSSHMTNIVSILREAHDEKSLVLLDELGAGTDPAEGAVLAIAILNALHRRGARTVATTHYSDLKVFAYNTPGVQNASVDFDPETLRPTYRLLIGLPGRSNAFAISARLGLDESIIEEARSLLAPGRQRVEDLIGRIAAEKRVLEEERKDAAILRRRLQEEEEEYRKELTRLKEERNRLLAEAREEARSLVRETRREMENLLRELREAAPQEQSRMVNSARRRMKEKLETFEEPKPAPAGGYQGEIRPGISVYLTHLGQKGEVLETNEDSVQVQVGALKVWAPRNVVAPLEKEGQETGRGQISYGDLAQKKAKTISPELDLRGLTVEEAIMAVDKYLDEALLAGLPSVRIIHGKGTGALRSAISEFVRGHRQIKSSRWGETGEGGMGVTVVEFKR